MNLQKLFDPNSVAVIGANNTEGSVGYALMKNILAGKTREVYPITLDEKEVFGHVAYTSVTALPKTPDIAIIAIPAPAISKILKECAEKGVTTAVVISAGFKEAGEEGKKLEVEMRETADKYDITLLGPNCLGVMDAHTQWNASFAVNSPLKGGLGFVSQSGALGTALLDWANREGVGFSKFVSLGNEAQLTELEFLEYLRDDDETKAVLLYLEKVTNGAKFLELARSVTEKKPLVVLRAGRSARGSKAVASHTGSLAPSDKVFEAALRQAGAIPVDSTDTLFALAKLFELGITSPLQNLVILTNGGGPSVNTADLIGFSRSLELVEFTEKTKGELRSVLPPMAAVNNPIDVIGDAGPQRYKDTLNILLELDRIDAIITLVTPQMMTDPKDIAKVFVEMKHKKPIIPVFMGGDTVQSGIEVLHENSMLSFSSPANVVAALDALARGAPKPEGEAATHNTSTHLTMLPLEKMQRVLEQFNLYLDGEYVKHPDEIQGALERLGNGPYAMKAISTDLVHKSDLHAVKLNLKTAVEIEASWHDMQHYIDEHTKGTRAAARQATIEGVLIQKMVRGVECIIGMKRDATFGPVIIFGLGGIFVEILKDSSMRIAPVTMEEALKQIHEIQGLPLLTGARGAEPVDLEALATMITSLSTLALEHPEIEEIDFNPVFATPTGTSIVDARMMVK